MQLFETSIDLGKMGHDHPFTYKTITEMRPDELIGCWVNLKDSGWGPHEWAGLVRFYRGHVLGARGSYSAHGYLWFRLAPLVDLWRAWGFSVKPNYSLKPLKHAPGQGMEWELIASADTPDELLGELNRLIALAKHSGARGISLLKADARRLQLGVLGDN